MEISAFVRFSVSPYLILLSSLLSMSTEKKKKTVIAVILFINMHRKLRHSNTLFQTFIRSVRFSFSTEAIRKKKFDIEFFDAVMARETSSRSDRIEFSQGYFIRVAFRCRLEILLLGFSSYSEPLADSVKRKLRFRFPICIQRE